MRARLLLAGPGRQDLTGEFGLDVTVPGYHSARYPGTARVRQGTRGLVNPISVPRDPRRAGAALENWSGSENADAPWLERLIALGGARRRPRRSDRAAARRALLLDLRNLGTLGLQQDSFPGLLWSDAIYGHATLSPGALAAIPPMYSAASRAARSSPIRFARPARDPAAVARGRALFTDRIVGTIANRQILKLAPSAYAAANLDGPILAPIDPTKPLEAKLPVRCADCHTAAPLENQLPLAANPPPLGRCSHCHCRPQPPREWNTIRAASIDAAQIPLGALPLGRAPAEEVAFCGGCHSRHRDFGPLVYSSSRLFPFDADGDGDAQLNPAADARAGGIGTDPWLAFDVPRPEWPFGIEVPVIGDPVARRSYRQGAHRGGLGAHRAAPRPPRHRAVSAQRLGANAACAARSAGAPTADLPARQGRLRLRQPPARQPQSRARVRHGAHPRREVRSGRFFGDSVSAVASLRAARHLFARVRASSCDQGSVQALPFQVPPMITVH